MANKILQYAPVLTHAPTVRAASSNRHTLQTAAVMRLASCGGLAGKNLGRGIQGPQGSTIDIAPQIACQREEQNLMNAAPPLLPEPRAAPPHHRNHLMVLGQIGNRDELHNPVINQRSGPPPLLLRETKDWLFWAARKAACDGH